jgi:hypothetical protein
VKFGTAIVGLPGFVVGYVIGVSEERQSDLPIAAAAVVIFAISGWFWVRTKPPA